MTERDREEEQHIHELHEREQRQADMDKYSQPHVPDPEFAAGQNVTVQFGIGKPFPAVIVWYGFDDWYGCAGYRIVEGGPGGKAMVVLPGDVKPAI